MRHHTRRARAPRRGNGRQRPKANRRTRTSRRDVHGRAQGRRARPAGRREQRRRTVLHISRSDAVCRRTDDAFDVVMCAAVVSAAAPALPLDPRCAQTPDDSETRLRLVVEAFRSAASLGILICRRARYSASGRNGAGADMEKPGARGPIASGPAASGLARADGVLVRRRVRRASPGSTARRPGRAPRPGRGFGTWCPLADATASRRGSYAGPRAAGVGSRRGHVSGVPRLLPRP
jgi:hypothetical protein